MEITHREFLPSATKSVHASTIEIWKDHPVFSWFGGSREGAPDVGIYLYNLDGNGGIIQIGNNDAMPRWNPILVNLGDRIILFEKAGIFCDRWQTFIHNITNWENDITPKDIYKTRVVLPAGLNGPVKSRPIVKDNRMYCGSSVETPYDWVSYIEEYVIDLDIIFDKRSYPLYVRKETYTDEYSGRTGKTLGVIQPTLWEYNGKLSAFFRSSKGLGTIYYSTRHDDGNWSFPCSTNLPNPNSAVDVATHNGFLYLVWNPDASKRTPLVLSRFKLPFPSLDGFPDLVNINALEPEETITISDDLNVDNFAKKSCNSPELSYPYIIEYNGQLHLTYTYGRSKIEYVVVSI